MRKLSRHSALCKCRWERLETMDTASDGLVMWNLGSCQGSQQPLWTIRADRQITERSQARFSRMFQASMKFLNQRLPKFPLYLHVENACYLITIYMPQTSLHITVMVTLYSHKLLYHSALFCSEMSYSDVQKRAWFEIKQIYLHFLIFNCLQKLKWSNAFWEFQDWR